MKHKKVVLVNPFPYYAEGINQSTIYPPLGLATMAAYLEQFGFECKIIDANVYSMRNEEVLKQIKEFDADIAGVQMNIVTVKGGSELCRMIKTALHIPVIMGGPFATSQCGDLLKDTTADCITIGEGEQTFHELCDGVAFANIKGIAYLNKDGTLQVNDKRPLIPDINVLPMTAWHLLPPLKLYKSRSRRTPLAPMFTSRGCPYKCTFCTSSSPEGPFANKFRARSAEKIVDEIEHLVKKYGVREIDILDDNLTFDMVRANQICDLMIARNLKVAINVQNGLRADRLTRDLVFKLAKIGVYKIGIGIESGNTEVLKSIRKGLDLRAVENAVKWCREAGILTVGFFMLGFPKDTEQTLQETIDFAIKLNPSIANFSVVLPLPGTELYNEIKANGWFTKNVDKGSNVGFYGNDFSFETPHLKMATIAKYQKKAYADFYFRPGKIFETIKDIKSYAELKWTVGASIPLIKIILGLDDAVKNDNVEAKPATQETSNAAPVEVR